MTMAKKRAKAEMVPVADTEYGGLVTGISTLLEQARRLTARSVNNILTATYWEVGRQIVQFEQGGQARAEYGEALLVRLGKDLSGQHGRGFSHQGLYKMRAFYLGWQIFPTASGKLAAHVKKAVPSSSSGKEVPEEECAEAGDFTHAGPVTVQMEISLLAGAFPLPWSIYVRLMSVGDLHARSFYETEAIRGGWTVRQLDRQINSMFYERVLLSRCKAAMLEKGEKPLPEDALTVREQLRDPYVLEFLDLKDEYAETDLEEALVRRLEDFLLELGTGFTFVARQKNFRVGDETYHVDLLLFNRLLRCLVIIDLKRGKFTHADAGQMNLYLNYAKENWTMPGENEPVGIILCSQKNDAVVHYATGGINTQVFASQYLAALPDVEVLRQELIATERALELRAIIKGEPAP
jgi:predicted nuclease of restriction endonuclease-like (RecB) superfamily